LKKRDEVRKSLLFCKPQERVMKRERWNFYAVVLSVLVLLALTACVPVTPDAVLRTAAPAAGDAPDTAMTDDPAVVRITLLQMNDVYEITPVGGLGGLARVATIRNELLAENPNTFTILAGDLFNPSALGTARVDGQRLNGKQIVDVMNVLGLDYATFGNHEFDLNEQAFGQRMQESKTTWFSSNVTLANGQPITNVVPNVILDVTNAAGTAVRLGLFGVTAPLNQVGYVAYRDVKEAVQEQVTTLKDQTDILVAVTHLFWDDDRDLAVTIPEIDLILGGHEHENIQTWRGADLTPIVKADANARTVYIHELAYNTTTGKLTIDSRLRLVDADIPDDPTVAAAVDKWVQLAFDGFRSEGFTPEAVVTTLTEPLDGTEASVRYQPTRLTELIAQGLLASVEDAELAIFNGGSVRIDDVLQPGPITQYDVIRVMPFGNKAVRVEMKGTLLQDVLDAGAANQGTGGYLQTANVEWDPAASNWQINGEVLDPERTYRVATTDFLISGRERGLDFLKTDNPDLKATLTGNEPDMRIPFIAELQKAYGQPEAAAPATTSTESTAPVAIAQLYAAALQDAKVAEPNEIVDTLTAITPYSADLTWQNDRVLVVTWTSWNGYDNLVGQETTLGREVWVTAVPQLQGFCQSYAATPETSLTLRLEQLLGLPANNGKTRFVQMWANPADMLRPSPDGEVDDTVAELEMPGPEHFPSQQEYEFHRDWFNLQMSLQAYDDPSKGYPWTRLGYTYDWGNPASEVGLSEFVVAAGSTVAIESVSALEAYCGK
jgi:5'-nucleotidase